MLQPDTRPVLRPALTRIWRPVGMSPDAGIDGTRERRGARLAASGLKAALKRDPDDVMLLNARALQLIRAGLNGDAIRLCSEALYLDHDNPETLRVLAQAFLNLGRTGRAGLALDETYETYTGVLPIDEYDVAVGSPIKQRRRYEQRIRKGSDGKRGYLAESQGPKSGLAHVYFLHGVMAQAKGAADAARDLLRKTIDRRPDFAPAWNNLGIAYLALRKDGEALKSLRKAVELAPTSWQAHLNLGIALRRSTDPHRIEKAVAAYERAMKLQPHDPAAHFNLGIVYLENERPMPSDRLARIPSMRFAARCDRPIHSGGRPGKTSQGGR